jgi:hypothetical protein
MNADHADKACTARWSETPEVDTLFEKGSE